jgi:hypothetical protein
MKHILTRKLAAAGAVAIAAALCGTGLASASTSAAAPSASGTEHLYLMTTQPSASRYSIIVNGVFTAGGVDISGRTTDTVRVTDGTFKVHHGGAVHVIKQQLNPRTCLAQFEATGAITLGGGTGAYKKLTGSGKALISELAIARRNSKGACNLNANPLVNEQTITATAHVRL